MSKHNKIVNFVFSLFILMLNSFFLIFELERLFRVERYIETYERSARISESSALEMQQINQLRASINMWVIVISIVLFLIMILKHKKYLLHFFYILSIINLIFLIGTVVLANLVPFNIIELVSPLSLSFLMNLIVGLMLFVRLFKTKSLSVQLKSFSR